MYNLFSYFSTNSTSKSKIAGTLAETVDISLRDQFVSLIVQKTKGSVLSRLSTLIRSHWFQKRSSVGVLSLYFCWIELLWDLVGAFFEIFAEFAERPLWNARSPSFFSEGLPPTPRVFVCESSALYIFHVSHTCRQVELLFKSISKVDSTIKERHKSAPCFATLRRVTIPAWQC